MFITFRICRSSHDVIGILLVRWKNKKNKGGNLAIEKNAKLIKDITGLNCLMARFCNYSIN